MNRIFVFGDFELSDPAFELRFRGARVDVQPKVLRLLLHLIENGGRAVSNEELLRVLWPDETVSSTSIRRAVFGARRALNESTESQSSIRTVRGRGYVFVAPVRTTIAEDPGASSVSHEGAETAEASPPFLGRENQLKTLEGRVREAMVGQARAVFLLGEAGIGKTRTLDEFCTRIRHLPIDVWKARCVETEGRPAFHPWRQILRQCVDARGATAVRDALGLSASDLMEALPGLSPQLAARARESRLDAAQSRFRFFESAVHLLRHASRERAIVVVIDDLHCADAPVLRLLEYVVRQMQGARLLVLGSLRSMHTQDAQVAVLLERVARDDHAEVLELGPLAGTHLASFLERELCALPPDGVVASLHDRTGGNPLFWKHIVDVYRAERRCGRASGWEWFERLPQAPGLVGAVERHLEMLSNACRELLEIAAVLGPRFSVALLARVRCVPAEEVIELLSEARVHGVLAAQAEPGYRRFSHSVVRDVLYERLPRFERARLHGAAALALDAYRPGASGGDLAELAHHFSAAAPAHDGGRAVRACSLAAASAVRQLAYEDAVRWLNQALALLDFAEPDGERRLQLLLEKAAATLGAGDAEAARDAFLSAAAIARELGDTDGVVRAAIGVGRPPETGAADEERITLLEEALRIAEANDERRPLLKALHAKALTYSTDAATVRRMVGEAVEAARASPEAGVLGQTLRQAYLILSDLRSLADRQRLTAELLTLARTTGEQELCLTAQLSTYQSALENGDVDGATAAVSTIDVLGEAGRQPLARWYALQFRAMRAIMDGQLQDAEKRAHDALEVGLCAGDQARQHVYFVQLYSIRALQGRFAEVEQVVRLGAARYPVLFAWRAAVACIDAELGRTDLAREELDRLMQEPHESSKDPLRYNALPAVAELCALLNEKRHAARLYETLLPVGHQIAIVAHGIAMRGPIAKILAMLSTCVGEFGRAEAHLHDALSLATKMRSPPMMAGVDLELARLHAQRGEPGDGDRASEYLNRALVCSESLGIGSIALRCRQTAEAFSLGLRRDT